MITKATFKALVMSHGRAGTRLPRQLPPVAIARAYKARLIKGPLTDAMRLVRERLVPALERMAAGASRVATTDAKDDVGEILDELRGALAEKWTRERFIKVVKNVGPELEKFQAAQLNNQMRALVTVDVVGSEPWLEPAIAEFTRENVALIRTIPTTFFNELETNLAREIADGVRWEEMVTTIQDRYDVAASRAALIARDQVGKFAGDLNRVRQSDLGITHGVWRGMNDNRERDEHLAREGQSFAWSEGIDGETPGEPVLCRCYGEPDIAALLEE